MKVTEDDSPAGDVISERLRSAIISGQFLPGVKLVQQEIAEQFHVSRTPVRQALERLTQEGLVRHVVNAGFFVDGLSPEDIHEIFLLRAVIESKLASLAIPYLDADAQQRLDAMLRVMDKHLEANTLDRFAELGRQFHVFICTLPPCRRFREALETAWQICPGPLFVLVPETAYRSQREHYRIVEALLGGREERVEKSVYEHIMRARDDCLTQRLTSAAQE